MVYATLKRCWLDWALIAAWLGIMGRCGQAIFPLEIPQSLFFLGDTLADLDRAVWKSPQNHISRLLDYLSSWPRDICLVAFALGLRGAKGHPKCQHCQVGQWQARVTPGTPEKEIPKVRWSLVPLLTLTAGSAPKIRQSKRREGFLYSANMKDRPAFFH